MKKLRAHRAAATFFLVGKEIRAYTSLIRLEEPLATFGDHTMTHPFLPALARSGMVWQIAAAQALIERVTGRPVTLFRPPYEGRTVVIDREARRLGMLEVLWNVDSRDSLGDTNYLGIERNVIAGLRPGSIVLMHENHGQTIRALPTILGGAGSAKAPCGDRPRADQRRSAVAGAAPPRGERLPRHGGRKQRWLTGDRWSTRSASGFRLRGPLKI